MPLAKGSPFITAVYTGGSRPLLSTTWDIVDVSVTPWAVPGGISAVESSKLRSTAPSSAACSDKLACATLGLVGDCCPTSEGTLLGCCGADLGSTGEKGPAAAALVGEAFYVTLSNGQNWVLYASTIGGRTARLSWTRENLWLDQDSSVRASNGGGGDEGVVETVVIRLARVPEEVSGAPQTNSDEARASTLEGHHEVSRALAMLESHRCSYATGGRVDWELLPRATEDDTDGTAGNSGDVARLSFEWTTTTIPSPRCTIEGDSKEGSSGELLMLALPHHVDAMSRVPGNAFAPPLPPLSPPPLWPPIPPQSPRPPFDDTQATMAASRPVAVGFGLVMQTMKGPARAVIGASWTMDYALPAVSTFDAARPVNETLASMAVQLTRETSCDGASVLAPWSGMTSSDVIRSFLASDATKLDPAEVRDIYGFGKRAARLGRLALIASQLGESATAKRAALNLGSSLSPWLSATNADALKYDATWGGLVTSDSLADAGRDFGNAMYNDHHFHYGYLLYAAAAAAHVDEGFLLQEDSKKAPLPQNGRSGFEPAPNEPVSPHPHAAVCSGNPHCAALGLVGDCCPTPEGSTLGCCDAVDPAVIRSQGVADASMRRLSHSSPNIGAEATQGTLSSERLAALLAIASDIATPLPASKPSPLRDNRQSETSNRPSLRGVPRSYKNGGVGGEPLSPQSLTFPVARHKDFYEGHSWASGLYPMANGKSQESVSEACNGYYAVALLARVVSDTLAKHRSEQAAHPASADMGISKVLPPLPRHLDQVAWSELRDWGRLLAAMEITAAHRYWQVPRTAAPPAAPDVTESSAEYRAPPCHAGCRSSGTSSGSGESSDVYPAAFAAVVHGMVGVVGASDASAGTWFGAAPE